MVDIEKLIKYLEASRDISYRLYTYSKDDGDELEALKCITEMRCKQTFIMLLQDEEFLDKMYKTHFLEQAADAD